MSLLSESSLLVQLAQCDPIAWRSVVADEHARIYRLASRLVPAEADDITQETFWAAWKNISQFNGQSKFSTWLYGIALNQCRLARRKHQQQAAKMKAFAEEKQSCGTVQDDFEALDDCELVRKAFDRLDEESQLVLTLLHYEGLTYAQLGEALGWSSKGTVFVKVQKATEQMKKLLSQLRGGGC